MAVLSSIVSILYLVLGYKAMQYLWWSKRHYFYSDPIKFYGERIITVVILGWIVIPIFLISKAAHK